MVCKDACACAGKCAVQSVWCSQEVSVSTSFVVDTTRKVPAVHLPSLLRRSRSHNSITVSHVLQGLSLPSFHQAVRRTTRLADFTGAARNWCSLQNVLCGRCLPESPSTRTSRVGLSRVMIRLSSDRPRGSHRT